MSQDQAESRTVTRPISIIMDDREPRDVMMQALSRCGCFAVDVQHLPVGDYLIDDALLIERKTLPDLVRSVLDGRLFQQALRLVEAKYPAALILEGSARDLQECEMRWEAIQGALVTVTLFMGLPVLRSRCPEETARMPKWKVSGQTPFARSDTRWRSRASTAPLRIPRFEPDVPGSTGLPLAGNWPSTGN